MNKQGSKENPNGGIEWTHILGPGTGFTTNPIRGCRHQCKWQMPAPQGGEEGKIVTCYAKAQKERLRTKEQKAAGTGLFEELTFHPEVLDAIRNHKTPAGIFIDSTSDLFGQGVEDDMISRVLSTMLDCPRHRFFALTKNPTRLRQFAHYPRNLLLGVSLPPTFMFGKELTLAQQQAWFTKAMECLAATDAAVKWVSLEPLSWDCSYLLGLYRNRINWAVIGAASDGARTYQPDQAVLTRVLGALACPVFFKGNLRNSIGYDPAKALWRQEFPKL